MARGDPADEQWAVLETLLPKGKKPGRPPAWTRRQLIDGIRFQVRTGIPRRDMPKEYGPWGRAYDLFRRWQRGGTWQRSFTRLQARADAKDLITWDLNVDPTVCRTHQHAAGARKRGSCKRSCPAASPSSPTTTASGLTRRPSLEAGEIGAAAWLTGPVWVTQVVPLRRWSRKDVGSER
ncbi:transposase [Streptomyces sp. NPDC014735]|uniref:transposase n=1 Tax=unclassified Streptomyces TaxID=2593676 RepID=UPI0036F6AD17